MKNINQKELFIISVTIFFTIMLWIFADLHHISRTEKLPPHDPALAKKIEVTIDTDVFNKLESKN